MLPDATKFYINGEWVSPQGGTLQDIINPATEEAIGQIALGTSADVDAAVAAAKAAFPAWSQTTLEERKGYLQAILGKVQERQPDMAAAISAEMGAPKMLAEKAQAPAGMGHFAQILKVLEDFEWEEDLGTTVVRKEPIGVCAMITPWNWPANQVAAKVAPAIAAGCTMVLKPSELAPLDAIILAEILDEVGLPKGVFNLVHGDGPGVGAALTSHKDVDMISFTGSTRAGIAISEAAAKDIKRVSLELGGKSANIIMEDADIEKAVPASVQGMMMNSGQSCNAQTRMLVPSKLYDQVAEGATAVAKAMTAGPDGHIGPIANKNQYGKVKNLIEKGVEEGADLLAGGPDLPEGVNRGYYVQPTIFGNVTRDMTIAQEEIFGPVLSIMPYETLEEAVEIANESDYGLSGGIWGSDLEKINAVAGQLRTGNVHLNGAPLDGAAPFGGYKKSGNGREWGKYGLEEYLEIKAVFGAKPKAA